MRVAIRILAGVGVLLAIVVASVAITISTIDVNTLIAPVAARVKAATGRDLTVRGGADIKLSLQPRLILSDVTLSNAPWGAAPQLMTARTLEMQVALLPLLARRFELVEITLVGPVIALETDAKGLRNWETAPAAAGEVASATGVPAIGIPFAVGNIAIADGTVTYRDGATGAVTHVVIDRLLVRARDVNTPIAAQFRGRVDDIVVSVEGTLGPLQSLLERRWPFPVTLNGDVAGRRVMVQTNVRGDQQRYMLEDLKATFGAASLTGSFAIETGGPRPRLVFDLAAPVLAALDAALPVGAMTAIPAGRAASPEPERKRWILPDHPVNFGSLRMADAVGGIAIGRLDFPDGRHAENVRVKLLLDNGRLEMTDFTATMFGGAVSGSAIVDVRNSGVPSLVVRIDGRRLDLGAMLSAEGRPGGVRGGSTDLDVDLALRGASPHAWASTATGTFRAVVGKATLVHSGTDPDAPLNRLAAALNPLRRADEPTELACVVVRLSLISGVARIDRTVAIETPKVGISVSGALDFRDETLDLAIRPQVRKGIPVDVSALASLVRFSGPFGSPQMKIDPAGSAAAIASIGAVVGTGGLSAVGQALLSLTADDGAGPCRIALDADDKLRTAGAVATAASPVLEDLGKAIGRLFKR